MVIGHCIALDFIASAVVGGTSDYITLCGCNSLACSASLGDSLWVQFTGSLACSAFGGTHSPVQVGETQTLLHFSLGVQCIALPSSWAMCRGHDYCSALHSPAVVGRQGIAL